jgi:hypothetical protein
MVKLMKRPLLVVRTISLAAAAALATVGLTVAVSPAEAASLSVDTSACSNPMLSQPFAAWGDTSEYTLVPGQSPGSFNGADWQLSGGAKVVTVTLANGSTSTVLDLPSGSKAVSPVICVTSSYPTARAMVRNVKGAEGVFFYVAYEGTNTWGNPRNTGQIHGNGSSWSAVTPVNLQPNNTAGWQPMQITLVPGGKTSEFQVYNLYVDPHMRF